MKELRELYDKGTQGKWEQDIINITKETFGVSAENDDVIASCGGDDGDYNAQLIAAMHNAMPELLDAWEMVQALEWAEDWVVDVAIYLTTLYTPNPCDKCPMHNGVCKYNVINNGHKACVEACLCRDEWLRAWREAQKIEGVE